MESKGFGGFSLKSTQVTNNQHQDSRKNDDPELKSMVEEEPDYPDATQMLTEIQKKAQMWQQQKNSSPRNRKGSEEKKQQSQSD